VIVRKATFTTTFTKDVKQAKKRHYEMALLANVIRLLCEDRLDDPVFHDHPLSGSKKGFRECHIKPDWLLIYQSLPDEVVFTRTGTHADLFG
jgi:mRNA interferase YafQ